MNSNPDSKFIIQSINSNFNLLNIEDKVVRLLASNKLYNKYNKQRSKFFEDVKNPIGTSYWKFIGKNIK